MKIHYNLLQGASEVLAEVLLTGGIADRCLDKRLAQNRKWGARDRNFVASALYDTLRHLRLRAWQIGLKELPKTEADCQKLIGLHAQLQGGELPADWPNPQIAQETASENFALNQSYPDWLYARGLRLGQSEWEAALLAMNQNSRVALRVNLQHSNPQKLQKELAQAGIETEVLGPYSLEVTQRRRLQHLPAYEKGLFEIQDFSSQQLAPLLQVKPGMLVVDACAGGGGKSLHLADLMQDQGRIWSLDIGPQRLAQLEKRAARAQLRSIKTRTLRKPSDWQSLYNQADALLLDVPCSGSGVLRRQPERKWQLSPEEVQNYVQLQSDLLKRYSPICRVGGKLLYATCSLFFEENEAQIRNFLDSPQGQKFKLLEQARIWPQSQGFDGFFHALLERVEA